MQVDEAGTSRSIVLNLGKGLVVRIGAHPQARHTSWEAISIQVSDATEKPQMVTKASRSLTNESIGTSRVAVPFLYVPLLFLSSYVASSMSMWLTRELPKPGARESRWWIRSRKPKRFQALHNGPLFVMPNPWDAGSARLLAGMGFEGTGDDERRVRLDTWAQEWRRSPATRCSPTRARSSRAVDLPVSGCIQNGYGDAPGHAAETIRLAAEGRNFAGGSIEDAMVIPIDRSMTSTCRWSVLLPQQRRRTPCPSLSPSSAGPKTTSTASATWTTPSGACRPTRRPAPTCCSAPGLPDLDAIRTVLASISRPLNIVLWQKQTPYTIGELAGAGRAPDQHGRLVRPRRLYGAAQRGERGVGTRHAELSRYSNHLGRTGQGYGFQTLERDQGK